MYWWMSVLDDGWLVWAMVLVGRLFHSGSLLGRVSGWLFVGVCLGSR